MLHWQVLLLSLLLWMQVCSWQDSALCDLTSYLHLALGSRLQFQTRRCLMHQANTQHKSDKCPCCCSITPQLSGKRNSGRQRLLGLWVTLLLPFFLSADLLCRNILLYWVFSLQYMQKASLKLNNSRGMQGSYALCTEMRCCPPQRWRQHIVDSLVHFVAPKGEQFIPLKMEEAFFIIINKSSPLSIVLSIFLQAQWEGLWKEPHLLTVP